MLDSVKAILKTISPSSQTESTTSGNLLLEQYLKDLRPYASNLCIHLLRDGWWATAEIRTPAVGAVLKVQSDTLSCPYDAAKQLHERVMAVLRPTHD